MKLFKNINTSNIEDYLIFLDIDGTLATDNKRKIDNKILLKIKQLKQKNKIFLCSNSNNHRRNNKVAEILEIDYIETDIKKPSKKILALLDDSDFSKKLVIGDKFFTDGLFAKNIKADFLKVKRITSEKDRFYIKIFYWLDDFLSKILWQKKF